METARGLEILLGQRPTTPLCVRLPDAQKRFEVHLSDAGFRSSRSGWVGSN